MVNWSLFQSATAGDSRPTPGWLLREICQDVCRNPMDCADVAEYLMQCVCSNQLNVQLKAVLVIKHLAADDVSFQRYFLSCPGALKILRDIAAPPLLQQARSLESQEVKTVREATRSALESVHTPHTVEKSTEAASLRERIQGFGNYAPPPEAPPRQKPSGVVGQVAGFVGGSVGDVVEDLREKGPVVALKDATIDALDLVLDGVDAVWGWVAGKSDDCAPRICQAVPALGPVHADALPGAYPMPHVPDSLRAVRASLAGDHCNAYQTPSPGAYGSAPGGQRAPRPRQVVSASNHYAAAFGGEVVGANNPVFVCGAPSFFPVGAHPLASQYVPSTASSAPASVCEHSLDVEAQAPLYAQGGVVASHLVDAEPASRYSASTEGGAPPSLRSSNAVDLLTFDDELAQDVEAQRVHAGSDPPSRDPSFTRAANGDASMGDASPSVDLLALDGPCLDLGVPRVQMADLLGGADSRHLLLLPTRAAA